MDGKEGQVWVIWFEGEKDTGLLRFLPFHAHCVESQTCGGGGAFSHAFTQYTTPLIYTGNAKRTNRWLL